MMNQRPLRILFDAHPLIGRKTGVGYYTSQLISQMAARYPDELSFIGYYHNFLLRKPAITEPAAPNIRYRPISLFPGQIVNQLRRWHINLPIELLTLTRADFIFYPNYLGLPSMFGTPNAPVIHDLTFVDHPETMSQKNLHDLQSFAPGMMRQASFVVTVSEFGKRRIGQEFSIPADDILVTYIPPPPAHTLEQTQAQELLHKQSITKPYLLFLSTIEPRKNVPTLLDAYVKLPVDIRNRYSLVLAGKVDWKYAETKARIEELQSQGHDIMYLGYVDDDTRAALYSQASLFVFPPIYEGFGMPILEAFNYGIPCAISDIPVFHEVAGDAAAYFDPGSADDIAAVIVRELTAPTISADQRQSQLASFSWDTVCRKMYDRILAATGRQTDAGHSAKGEGAI